jgi:hypothetical protein
MGLAKAAKEASAMVTRSFIGWAQQEHAKGPFIFLCLQGWRRGKVFGFGTGEVKTDTKGDACAGCSEIPHRKRA